MTINQYLAVVLTLGTLGIWFVGLSTLVIGATISTHSRRIREYCEGDLKLRQDALKATKAYYHQE